MDSSSNDQSISSLNPDMQTLLVRLDRAYTHHHAPMAALKLALLATNAVRVLRVLAQHADVSKNFDDVLKSACPDWRNPGATDDPLDLIATALFHALAAMQQVMAELGGLLHQKAPPEPQAPSELGAAIL